MNIISNGKRRSLLVLALVMCMALMSGTVFAATSNQSAGDQDKAAPYFQKYSVNPESSIGARGIDGQWAACTTVEGKTYQEQLDNKLAYIEELYAVEKELFVIEDGISLEETTDMYAVRYLFDKSPVYQTLVTVKDTLYIQSECSFNRLADAEQSPLYDRYVFYLEQPAKLELSASYALQQGKMALWIVSPEGEFLYQNNMSDSFNDTISLSLDKGLHSVILVNELDNGQMEGEKFIQGRCAAK